MHKRLVTILIGCLAYGQLVAQMEQEKPLNVILMIGDGTGLSQISSAYYFGEGEPNYSRFTSIGLAKTSSGSHKITDSAAGATAYSAGKKTYNGAIGVDMDTNAVETILETLSKVGYHTGILATSSVTHATPGSFYAHVESRNMQEEIAADFLKSNIDFLAGGGTKFFFHRSDGANYYEALLEKGYVVDTSGIQQPITDYDKKYAYLVAKDGLTPKHHGRDDFLPDVTAKALDYLTQKKAPFFLMIEGSQIDWGGHANNGEYVVQELLDFDKTIGVVLDYVEAHPNTIVVVTADHETGGFTLAGKPKVLPYNRQINDYNKVVTKFTTHGHSGALVPVFAMGRGQELFQGVYENTAVYDKLMELTKQIK